MGKSVNAGNSDKAEFLGARADAIADGIVRDFYGDQFDAEAGRNRRRRRLAKHLATSRWTKTLPIGWAALRWPESEDSDRWCESYEMPEDASRAWEEFHEWLAAKIHSAFELALPPTLNVESALASVAWFRTRPLDHAALSPRYLLDQLGLTARPGDGARAADPHRRLVESIAHYHSSHSARAYQANVHIAVVRALKKMWVKATSPYDPGLLEKIVRNERFIKDDILRKKWHKAFLLAKHKLEVSGYFDPILPYVNNTKVRKIVTRDRELSDVVLERRLADRTKLNSFQRALVTAHWFQTYESAVRLGLIRWRAGCLLGDHERVTNHGQLAHDAAIDEQDVHPKEVSPIAGVGLRTDYDLDTAVALSAAASEVDQSDWGSLVRGSSPPPFEMRTHKLIEEFDVRSAGEPGFRPLNVNEREAIQTEGRDGIRRHREEARFRAAD